MKTNPRYTDLAGKSFGSWSVISRCEPRSSWAKPRWNVVCTCGSLGQVYSAPLLGGRSKSCGCNANGRPPEHGMHLSPEYKAWCSMWSRCTWPGNASYARYGARGISVSEEWRSFPKFYEDLGPRPSAAHSLERAETNGNYEKSNCRWATPTEQANNRSSNRRLEVRGVSKTASEWARESGVKANTILARINRWGWDPERAVFHKTTTTTVGQQ